MSVKVKLNNRKFLGGNSLLIGSRLFEEEVLAQNGQQPQAAQAEQPAAQASQQPAAQAEQPAAQTGQQPQAGQQSQPEQKQEGQQKSVADSLQEVLAKHFNGLQNAIAADLKNIPNVQWKNVVAPTDQSLNSILTALQEFIKQNVEVAKSTLENQNKQEQQPTENQEQK